MIESPIVGPSPLEKAEIALRYLESIIRHDQSRITRQPANGIKSAASSLSAAALAAVPIPGAAELAPAVKDLERGIVAYHGSPHSFDQFSLDKIGTGEGAQAYGHGLYFASDEGVAKSYRDSLSPTMDKEGVNQKGAWNFLNRTGGDIDNALKLANTWASQGNTPMGRSSRDILPILESWKGTGPIQPKDQLGSMYQVHIAANPDHFLDWDKPLSEQHPKVQSAFVKAGMPTEPEYSTRTAFGRETLEAKMPGGGQATIQNFKDADPGQQWAVNLGSNDPYQYFGSKQDALAAVKDRFQKEFMIGGAGLKGEDVAAKLKAQGIPGIKYLDAGSRSAGDGSRNYVVFDDKMIDIIKKYGIAPAFGLGGASALSPDSGEAQAAPASAPNNLRAWADQAYKAAKISDRQKALLDARAASVGQSKSAASSLSAAVEIMRREAQLAGRTA